MSRYKQCEQEIYRLQQQVGWLQEMPQAFKQEKAIVMGRFQQLQSAIETKIEDTRC